MAAPAHSRVSWQPEAASTLPLLGGNALSAPLILPSTGTSLHREAATSNRRVTAYEDPSSDSISVDSGVHRGLFDQTSELVAAQHLCWIRLAIDKTDTIGEE